MTRRHPGLALGLTLVLLGAGACGKYGPPLRSKPTAEATAATGAAESAEPGDVERDPETRSQGVEAEQGP